MNNLVSVVLVALNLCLLTSGCDAGKVSVEDAVQAVSKSLVVVHGSTTDGQREVGTGFSINQEGLIVTALHLVRNGDIRVGVPKQGNYQSVAARLLTKDEDEDIAILRVPVRLPPLKLHDTPPRSGMAVLVSGFAFGTRLDQFLVVSSSLGMISSVRPNDQGRTGALLLDARIEQGHSGSPVYSPVTREVVGIISAKLIAQGEDGSSGTTFASATQSSVIRRLVAKIKEASRRTK